MARISSTVLNWTGEIGLPFPVPDHLENVFSFSLQNDSCEVFRNAEFYFLWNYFPQSLIFAVKTILGVLVDLKHEPV